MLEHTISQHDFFVFDARWVCQCSPAFIYFNARRLSYRYDYSHALFLTDIICAQ